MVMELSPTSPKKLVLDDERWGTGCAFLDYDLDGYVDLYVVNYMIFSTEGNQGWESRGDPYLL